MVGGWVSFWDYLIFRGYVQFLGGITWSITPKNKHGTQKLVVCRCFFFFQGGISRFHVCFRVCRWLFQACFDYVHSETWADDGVLFEPGWMCRVGNLWLQSDMIRFFAWNGHSIGFLILATTTCHITRLMVPFHVIKWTSDFFFPCAYPPWNKQFAPGSNPLERRFRTWKPSFL